MREAGVIVEMFKALGDPVRLRLFALITSHDELCVCHLTAALSLPQSTVSRQLALLRHAGLVQARRDGKWIYYRAGGNALPALQSVIDACASSALLADDRNRLHQVLAPESANRCNTSAS